MKTDQETLSTQSAINTIIAKDAIREKLYSYCRGVDRLDHELGYSVFTETSQLDYGETFQGTGKGFIDWCIKSHLDLGATSHNITNIKIIVKDDKAYSEAYILGRMRSQPTDDGDIFEINVNGRYIDQWICINGDWRVEKRRYVQDFAKMVKIEMDTGSEGATRDKNDPSYTVMQY